MRTHGQLKICARRPAVAFPLLLLGILGALPTVTGYGQTLGGVPYVNSWIGNTHGSPQDHIPHSIDNIYVTPSGKVATITGWDEGGANVVLYDKAGAKIGVPVQSGTGTWGRNSGRAGEPPSNPCQSIGLPRLFQVSGGDIRFSCGCRR